VNTVVMRAVSESKTEKPRLQAGCDKALVEPKGKVIVVVGHPETRTRLLEGDPPEQ